MPFSPRDHQSIVDSVKNSDIVINMIGKYYETKHIVPTRRADGSISRINYSYEDVNVIIPQTIAKIAKENGVKAFIHMSALAASPDSASVWSQTKARGEAVVQKEFPGAVSNSYNQNF
jgi:NADH dehydrogenase (ubiquinone) 1 alpha subcomplex subunit 9